MQIIQTEITKSIIKLEYSLDLFCKKYNLKHNPFSIHVNMSKLNFNYIELSTDDVRRHSGFHHKYNIQILLRGKVVLKLDPFYLQTSLRLQNLELEQSLITALKTNKLLRYSCKLRRKKVDFK